MDHLFEPFMASQGAGSVFVRFFGVGKGSGAAFFFGTLWIMGVCVCLLFRKDRTIWRMEGSNEREPGKSSGCSHPA